MRTISDTTKAKIFSFLPGKKYYISDRRRPNGKVKEDENSTPLYTFEYVKRINKIHVFKEVNFGWTKGISDLQLADKNVQEVKN